MLLHASRQKRPSLWFRHTNERERGSLLDVEQVGPRHLRDDLSATNLDRCVEIIPIEIFRELAGVSPDAHTCAVTTSCGS
jgi:hypothetical protein